MRHHMTTDGWLYYGTYDFATHLPGCPLPHTYPLPLLQTHTCRRHAPACLHTWVLVHLPAWVPAWVVFCLHGCSGYQVLQITGFSGSGFPAGAPACLPADFTACWIFVLGAAFGRFWISASAVLVFRCGFCTFTIHSGSGISCTVGSGFSGSLGLACLRSTTSSVVSCHRSATVLHRYLRAFWSGRFSCVACRSCHLPFLPAWDFMGFCRFWVLDSAWAFLVYLDFQMPGFYRSAGISRFLGLPFYGPAVFRSVLGGAACLPLHCCTCTTCSLLTCRSAACNLPAWVQILCLPAAPQMGCTPALPGPFSCLHVLLGLPQFFCLQISCLPLEHLRVLSDLACRTCLRFVVLGGFLLPFLPATACTTCLPAWVQTVTCLPCHLPACLRFSATALDSAGFWVDSAGSAACLPGLPPFCLVTCLTAAVSVDYRSAFACLPACLQFCLGHLPAFSHIVCFSYSPHCTCVHQISACTWVVPAPFCLPAWVWSGILPPLQCLPPAWVCLRSACLGTCACRSPTWVYWVGGEGAVGLEDYYVYVLEPACLEWNYWISGLGYTCLPACHLGAGCTGCHLPAFSRSFSQAWIPSGWVLPACLRFRSLYTCLDYCSFCLLVWILPPLNITPWNSGMDACSYQTCHHRFRLHGYRFPFWVCGLFVGTCLPATCVTCLPLGFMQITCRFWFYLLLPACRFLYHRLVCRSATSYLELPFLPAIPEQRGFACCCRFCLPAGWRNSAVLEQIAACRTYTVF